MFFELYGVYFVAGAVIYVIARCLYYCFNLKNQPLDIKVKQGSNEDDLKTMDQLAEINDVDEDTDEENEYSPSLENVEHVPLQYERFTLEESIKRSNEYYQLMNKRRTVRKYSTKPVPKEILYNILRCAGTSPSGAHTEPWTYVLVTSLDMKENIRKIIEDEEEINYKKRMGKVWTTDLKPFKTNWIKEYLTEAPALILVFKQTYSYRQDGKKKMHYYNEQSICISAGILMTAIHYAGLVSLTSTPLNCGPALRSLLGRPISEKLVLLVPVGYPAENCMVPDLTRKPLEDIMVEF